MKLNADIGESFGAWRMGNDASLMPLIHQANIACGYHAGDALTMQSTLALAKLHKVEVGAHVAYPDLQGFGRRSMRLAPNELSAMIHAQIATLEGLAACQDTSLKYIKPHGALYNDMMQQPDLFEVIVMALRTYHRAYDLVIQALPDMSLFTAIAAKHNVTLRFEAFADRAYTGEGFLVSRHQANAVLCEAKSLQQAAAMVTTGSFLSECGKTLSLKIDTLCVHGDTPDALSLCQKIRTLINQNSKSRAVTAGQDGSGNKEANHAQD